MSKITFIGTAKIGNPFVLTNAIYNNFFYLKNFPELMHSKSDILKMFSGNTYSFLVFNIDVETKGCNPEEETSKLLRFRSSKTSPLLLNNKLRKQNADERNNIEFDKKKNLVAYLIGDFRTLADSRYVYYISYFYVLEKLRSKKIGSKLMDMVIKKCKIMGVSFIVLTCDTVDIRATKFYERYGFKLDPLSANAKRHKVFSLFL